MRRRNEDSVKHEVPLHVQRHQLDRVGKRNGPSNGTITPSGAGGYNGMLWTITALNLSGKSTLDVAIKPQNSTLTRQISIPLTGGSTPPPPSAPTNVHIIP
jgi:hypothetical protein